MIPNYICKCNVNDDADMKFFAVRDEYWVLILLSTVIKFRTNVI